MATEMAYETIPFPQNASIVYYLAFRRMKDDAETPFYVGETDRHVGRLGDYVASKLTAPTDFKVGVASKYLISLGYEVFFRFFCVPAKERRQIEAALVAQFSKTFPLLNDNLSEASFKNKSEEEARKVVQQHVDNEILKQ